MQPPHLLALDFDGVLCDGLQEYFQTACRTYEQVWPPASLAAFAERFYRLRPVIETGWEMPVLLRALVLGATDAEILTDWSAIAHQRIETEALDSRDLAQRLDATRDRWLQDDLTGWLSLHRFYPGVCEQLHAWLAADTMQVFIVTTKEGRFVQQLFQEQGIALPATQILGKETQQPKAATLQQLRAGAAISSPSLWFVEDRLKTLQSVAQQADLAAVRLFLADWGYNTAAARQSAARDPRVCLLSLTRFTADLTTWLAAAP